ncbi:MAG: hypothetical protein U0903_21100 [Planctomycetales bacterium]
MTVPCFGRRRQDCYGRGRARIEGLSLPDLLRAGKGPDTHRTVLFWMWGGPSQLETWDPKPLARRIPGPLNPIQTAVPRIGDL